MIREGSIRWNAVAEIIPTNRPRPAKRKSKRERKIHDDARAAKKERRCGSEKIHPREKRDERKKERETDEEKKKPSSHRANEPIFSHLDRPDEWTSGRADERTNAPGKTRRRKRGGGGKEVDEVKKEEVAMNFALPEDEGKEERGGAREKTRGGKK